MSAVGPVKEIGHLPTIKLQVQNQISEWYHWPKAYMILSCQTPAEELDENHQMEMNNLAINNVDFPFRNSVAQLRFR